MKNTLKALMFVCALGTPLAAYAQEPAAETQAVSPKITQDEKAAAYAKAAAARTGIATDPSASAVKQQAESIMSLRQDINRLEGQVTALTQKVDVMMASIQQQSDMQKKTILTIEQFVQNQKKTAPKQ